jgi:hypothetical protein
VCSLCYVMIASSQFTVCCVRTAEHKLALILSWWGVFALLCDDSLEPVHCPLCTYCRTQACTRLTQCSCGPGPAPDPPRIILSSTQQYWTSRAERIRCVVAAANSGAMQQVSGHSHYDPFRFQSNLVGLQKQLKVRKFSCFLAAAHKAWHFMYKLLWLWL